MTIAALRKAHIYRNERGSWTALVFGAKGAAFQAPSEHEAACVAKAAGFEPYRNERFDCRVIKEVP